MKNDEGFLNNVGKQMLIQLMNGNVRRFRSNKNSKDPRLPGVFFCLNESH